MQLTLTGVDLAVIAVYITALIGISVVAALKQTSEEAYFLGSRNTPWWLAGVSVLATLVSTLTYLSTPGEMIGHGAGYFASLVGVIAVVPLINWIIIPTLVRLQVTSVYEYLERRFSLTARLVGALVFVVTRIIWVGLITLTASQAVSDMTGWPIVWLMIGMGLFTAAYTMQGGLQAVLWTDFAQFVLLFGGALFVPLYVAWLTASTPAAWWSLFSEVGHDRAPVWSFDPTVRMTIIGIMIDTFIWNLCTHGADQVAAQRYLSTPSVQSARRSVWTYTWLVVATIALLALCGLAAFYFEYNNTGLSVSEIRADASARADKIFPQFIARHLPIGIRGLVIAALLAAAMSSMSSGMNSVSTVLVSDFFRRFSRQSTSDRYLMLAKILAGGVGVLSIGIAIGVYQYKNQQGWNLLEMIQRLNHLCVAPLGALFLAGLVYRRAGTAAALTGFTAGVLTSISVAFSFAIWTQVSALLRVVGIPALPLKGPISFMWIMPASFLVSMIVTGVMCLFVPRKSRESDLLP